MSGHEMSGHDGSGKWFDEVVIGERFARTPTVTETHLVLGAGLIGDFNPHHVDERYAQGCSPVSYVLGLPGTATRPGLPGCLNCRWLPRVATNTHPFVCELPKCLADLHESAMPFGRPVPQPSP